MSKTQHPTARRLRLPALRNVALAIAIGIVASATYAATTSPPATHGVPDPLAHASWMAHLHGASHAQHRARFEQLMEQAGTSQAQRQQIDALVARAMSGEHADMHAYHDRCGDLKALLAAPRIDAAAVARVRDEQDRLAVAMSQRLTDTAVAIAHVLTPEQRRQVEAGIDAMLATGIGHHAG